MGRFAQDRGLSLNKMAERKRRYTLVFHYYIGYGGYVVDFSRVSATRTDIKRISGKSSLHFIIEGWPPINYPDWKKVRLK